MTSRLRIPTLAFAGLSICLSSAVLGCAARTLAVFNSQQGRNPWFLPVWASHFDSRGLETLVGTSAAIIVLNVVLLAALFIPALPANFIVLCSSALSSMVAIIGLAVQGVLNNRSPRRDTLQTWTCGWTQQTSIAASTGGPPQQFNTLCQQTTFAYYTTIPILMLQLLLLGLGCYTVFARSSSSSRLSGARCDAEKGHELLERRSESESESVHHILPRKG